MMEDKARNITITITISQVEYDEIMSAIEFSMAQITGTKKILGPVRDRLTAEYGQPSWSQEASFTTL